MKNLTRIFLVIIFYFSAEALAEKSKPSAEIPTIVQKSFEQPSLVGFATLKFLGVKKVYDISLWSEGAGFSYEKKFAISILYNMNFAKDDLIARSLSEIKRLHKISAEEESSYVQQLGEIFRNVKNGDRKVAFFTPNQGVTMYHNDQKTGKISDPKFARLFVDIWLDERGSYPEVTRKIIGKSDL